MSLQHLPGAEKINISVMKGRDLKFEEFDKGEFLVSIVFLLPFGLFKVNNIFIFSIDFSTSVNKIGFIKCNWL